ncbi:MAG: endolytic transglycosylase MltG [Flavobacteriales bacterium]
MAKRKGKWLMAGAVLVAAAGIAAYVAWHEVMGPSTRFAEESRVLLIPTGSDLRTAMDSLKRIDAIHDERAAELLLKRGTIKPGRYRVKKGTSLRAIARMLHAGEQEPVRITFSNVDHLYELAGRLGRSLEPDSVAFLKTFLDPDQQREAGLDDATMISLFLPNTYELWWTTTPQGFVARMRKEHDAFWNESRRKQADAVKLSPTEVSTLASIVQAETVKMVDAPTIAGVYINRLRIGMPLQADPTLKFALGLDTVRRVLNRDKEVDSPYNTYRYAGLPPGPINMPEPRFIDAVLSAPKHEYLYFCARADLSGYSDFARTYEQHLVNARRYQKALNARKIYR